MTGERATSGGNRFTDTPLDGRYPLFRPWACTSGAGLMNIRVMEWNGDDPRVLSESLWRRVARQGWLLATPRPVKEGFDPQQQIRGFLRTEREFEAEVGENSPTGFHMT